MKDQKHISADDHIYLYGKTNFLYRCYFYTMSGLHVVNEFRNVFLGIFAIYITLKLTNPIWIPVMAFPSIFILIFLGRFQVHKLSKMGEWLSMRFATHYGIKNYGFSQQQVELLEEIRDLLKKQNNVK